MKLLTPQTMAEYASALSCASERSKIVAGGTDFTIKLRQGKFDPDLLIYPGAVPELDEIVCEGGVLRIGAMVTMSRLADVFSKNATFSAIADAAANVGSPQIRNKATMAGNLCNASPAGDMLPIALLYDARLELLHADGARVFMPVGEFLLGPQRTALAAQQAVTAVVIDAAAFDGWASAFYKIGSREFVSISREGLAALAKTGSDGRLLDVRLTLGAVANTPIRVPAAEELMRGERLDDALIERVIPLIAQTVHDNCRPANRLYKTEAARGLTADLLTRLSHRL